ncbi:MAG: hypothetical protein GX094_09855 [Clostridiales bacterium]|jgi:Ca2+/Na+ antiporter|nr:hypothetical protein [Clostridiales bacterium]
MTFLKNISDRIIEWNYYLDDDGRHESVTGWLLDIVLLIFTVFVASYLWFVYKTKMPAVSILLSASLAALIGYAFFKQKQKHLRKKHREKWENAANEYRLKGLLNLTHQQFKWTLAKTLFRSRKFEDIKVLKNYIKANHKNEKILIGFYHVPYTQYVPARELFRFSKLMMHYGYKTGLFFSSSAFDDACHRVAQDIPGVTIHLVDTTALIHLMERTGVFNDQKTIDKYLNSKIKNYKLQRKQSRKQLLPKPKNAKTYTVYGVLHLGAAFVFPSYFMYFFIVALFFVMLGLLVYITSQAKRRNSKKYDAGNHILL